MVTVRLNGTDVTDYLLTLPSLSFTRPELGQYTGIETLSIDGDNTNRFWDHTYWGSPLCGVILSNSTIEVYQDLNLSWQGKIRSIDIQGRKATVQCFSELARHLEINVPYYAGDTQTPGEIIKSILDENGIEYSLPSIDKSIQIHGTNGLFLTTYIDSQSAKKISDVLQSMCEIGVARGYFYNNKFYYETYDPDNYSNVSGSYSGDDLINPTKRTEYNPKIRGYSIKTMVSTVEKVDLLGDDIKTLTLDSTSPYQLSSYDGATWIGESYKTITGGTKITVSFEIEAQYSFSQGMDGFEILDGPLMGVYRVSKFSQSKRSINLIEGIIQL